MIAVDTSAIIAVVSGEEMAERCAEVLAGNRLIMSAGTLTECLIVGSRPEYRDRVAGLIKTLDPEVVAVGDAFARLAADAYVRWGKGFYAARLNYGDCFSYALAELYDCPLLYVGDDFVRTDVRSALG